MDLHVPEPDQGVRALDNLQRYITDGLDAVVIETSKSTVYPGAVLLRLAGNDRDLGIATERAEKIGGVVD